MQQYWHLHCLLGTLLTILLGCDSGNSGNKPAKSSQQILFEGCYQLIKERCVVDTNTPLSLWVESAKSNLAPSILLDGQPLQVEPLKIVQGFHFKLAAGASHQQPSLQQLRIIQDGNEIWRMSIVREPRESLSPKLKAAIEDGTLVSILSSELLTKYSKSEQIDLFKNIGNEYRKKGDYDSAEDFFARAQTVAQDLSDHQGLYSLASNLSFIYLNIIPDYERANKAIDTMASLRQVVGNSIFYHFNKAQLLKNQGKFKDAEQHLQLALEEAVKLEQQRYIAFIKRLKLFLLTDTGNFSAAETGYAELTANLSSRDITACEQVTQLTNHGWNRLLAKKRGINLGDPLQLFKHAQGINEEQCKIQKHSNALLVNIAIAHWLDGDIKAAKTLLEQIKQNVETLSFWGMLDILELEADLAINQQAFIEARKSFDKIARLAEQLDDRYATWLAKSGLIRLDLYENRFPNKQALDELFELQIQQLLNIHVTGDRFAFRQQFQRYYDQLVMLLLEQSQFELALYLLRQLRVIDHHLFTFNQKINTLPAKNKTKWLHWLARYQNLNAELAKMKASAWSLSLENAKAMEQAYAQGKKNLNTLIEEAYTILDVRYESDVLSEMQADELSLGFFDVGEQIVGFAYNKQILRSLTFTASDFSNKTNESNVLVNAFSEEISNYKKIRFIVSPRLETLDLHWTNFQGLPLATQKDVVYGHDIQEPAQHSNNQLKLLVADPNDDLQYTRKEIGIAKHAFESSKLDLTNKLVVLQGAKATKLSIIDSLNRADFFHFAGHGEVDRNDNLHSYLSLSQEERLRIGDILTLAQAPRAVLLSACYSDNALRGENPNLLGLAQAFMIAGSENVLASNGLLPDRVAFNFAQVFYRHLAPNKSVRDAIHASLAMLHKTQPDQPWHKYRLYVR